jgi:hypothetical protein
MSNVRSALATPKSVEGIQKGMSNSAEEVEKDMTEEVRTELGLEK